MEVNASQDQQHSPPSKGTVLQWDWMLVFIAEETCHIQALRSVCRDTVTEATTIVFCHLVFMIALSCWIRTQTRPNLFGADA